MEYIHYTALRELRRWGTVPVSDDLFWLWHHALMSVPGVTLEISYTQRVYKYPASTRRLIVRRNESPEYPGDNASIFRFDYLLFPWMGCRSWAPVLDALEDWVPRKVYIPLVPVTHPRTQGSPHGLLNIFTHPNEFEVRWLEDLSRREIQRLERTTLHCLPSQERLWPDVIAVLYASPHIQVEGLAKKLKIDVVEAQQQLTHLLEQDAARPVREAGWCLTPFGLNLAAKLRCGQLESELCPAA